MEHDLRYAAARRLLRDLDEIVALRENPLLLEYAGEPHEALRMRVLRAVESLDTGPAATTSSDRRYRLHQIILRCDLNGDSHKSVAAALGISRSQFYMDRRAAFLCVADALERLPAQPQMDGLLPDAFSLHLDYVEMLRSQGRFDAAWREALRVVSDVRGQPAEIELWSIVADASRFLGNLQQSLQAVNEMSRIAATYAPQQRRAAALRIAISEIALLGVQGRFDETLERFDQAMEDAGNEHAMYGSDLTLFIILLGFGAEASVERGHWQRAKALIRRVECIIDRSQVPYANARLHRLRARIAQERNGDSALSALELRDALRLLQHHRQLPEMAMATVEYGVALAGIDRPEAMRYIDYGLVMAKDVCGYDQYAMLVANAAPLFLERSGPDEALRMIADIRMRAPLSARAHLHLGIAEADARLARGQFKVASETGINVGKSLEDAALFPAAAKAWLIAIEAFARDGKTAKANQLFGKSKEVLNAHADNATRERALRSGLFLDSFVQ